ncbi:hypothetical protein TNCV_1048691 [Trichonephila clavipes]|nr:hypothetical protein TNCV_1048691 [Trichonephila clavipes]
MKGWKNLILQSPGMFSIKNRFRILIDSLSVTLEQGQMNRQNVKGRRPPSLSFFLLRLMTRSRAHVDPQTRFSACADPNYDSSLRHCQEALSSLTPVRLT